MFDSRFTRYWTRINGELSDVHFTITEPPMKEQHMNTNPTFGFLDAPTAHLPVDYTLKSPGELREILAKHVLRITFTTAEGEIRTMDVTQDASQIPETSRPKVNASALKDVITSPHTTPDFVDLRLFKVWAVDRAGWRSIRHDRIQRIQYVK